MTGSVVLSILTLFYSTRCARSLWVTPQPQSNSLDFSQMISATEVFTDLIHKLLNFRDAGTTWRGSMQPIRHDTNS